MVCKFKREVRLAVQTKDGITTEPVDMANALRTHWSRVFQARATTKHEILHQLMQDTPYGFHNVKWQEENTWTITQSDVEQSYSI